MEEARSEMAENQRIRESLRNSSNLRDRSSSTKADSMNEYSSLISGEKDPLDDENDLTAQLLKKMFLEDELDYSTESEKSDKVEYASDQEDEQPSNCRRKKKKLDEEFKESEIEADFDDDDVFMDELENESISENSD